MDIYVINLDKDVQRLHWMEQQLSKHKLEFLRIAAVDGAQIRLQQNPYWSDPRRSHLGTAETGCLLSHVTAWRLIAQANANHALVLEDDIHLSDDFAAFLHNLPLEPTEFCVHKLETFCANVTMTRQPTHTARSRKAYKLETNHGGAGAYILNRRTASHLLSNIELFDAAVDIELFDPGRRKTKNLAIYQWVPAPCIQDFLVPRSQRRKSFVSNIGMDRSDVGMYALKPHQDRQEIVKSWLRLLYTRLYSASLLRSGRMRRKVEFG